MGSLPWWLPLPLLPRSSPVTAWLVDTASLAMLDMLHTLLHMSELELDKPRMCPSPSPSRERLDTTLSPRPSELTLLPLLSTPTPSMELVTLVWLDMVLPTVLLATEFLTVLPTVSLDTVLPMVSSDTVLPTVSLDTVLPTVLLDTVLPTVSSDTLLPTPPLLFTPPLWSTLPPPTTPLLSTPPTPLPRCTPTRSPPTPTTTPSLMTTPPPSSTLARAATVLATLRALTLLPFPTAGSST